MNQYERDKAELRAMLKNFEAAEGIQAKADMSRAHMYRLLGQDGAPKPVQMRNMKLYHLSEVAQWHNSKGDPRLKRIEIEEGRA